MKNTQLSSAGFLKSLFLALDLHQVRYCVLHSYAGLPDELRSDLDMALHPSDLPRLALVFESVRQQGYLALQAISYSAGAGGSHYFVFGWFGNSGFASLAIDFTCQHREGRVILMPGEELVRGRRKQDLFWVPDPAIEFLYILAKKLLKGAVQSAAAERLCVLARELGREAAEEASGRLVPPRSRSRLVDACLNKTLSIEVAVFRRSVVHTIWRRDPLNRLRYWVTECPRLWMRLLKPTGMFVAVLGPDGVGKSSLLPQLVRQIGGCFRRHRVFHWRPQLLWHRESAPIQEPHSRANLSQVSSLIHLVGHTLDFIFGYWALIYPMRVQSGLVLFDRYFDDLTVDTKRYQYGGPLWLPRILRHLIPAPEVLLVLDAPADAILARKRELEPGDVVRLGRGYRNLAYQSKSTRIIDASGSPDVVAENAVRAISEHLVARFKRDHSRWTPNKSDARSGQLEEAVRWLASGTQSRHEGASTLGDRRNTFAVIPSSRNPRWIIPLHDSSLSTAAMKMVTPYTNRARFFKKLVSFALRLPASALPGDIISLMADGASPLEALVADKLGEPRPVFGISFGTSGRHRKLTVQVMSGSGHILAYIKIPMTNVGNDRVHHEATVLKRLSTYPTLRKHIPNLIFSGEWQDRCILIQDSLGDSSGPTLLTPAHFSFLQTLWNAEPAVRSGQEVVAEVSQEWEAVRERLDVRWEQLAEAALRVAKRSMEGLDVSCGITHGDFAPWNTRVHNGSLGVFDWECAGWSKPILWDVFHFETQSSTLLKHTSHKAIRRGDPRTFQSIYMMYLLSSTCQILRDEPSDLDGLRYRREQLARELLRPAESSGTSGMHDVHAQDIQVM